MFKSYLTSFYLTWCCFSQEKLSIVVVSVTIITSFNFLFHWSFQMIGPPSLTWLMQFYQSFNTGISSRGELYSFQGVGRQGITDDRWQPCWLQHWISRPWYLKCYQELSTSGRVMQLRSVFSMNICGCQHPHHSIPQPACDARTLTRRIFDALHFCFTGARKSGQQGVQEL